MGLGTELKKGFRKIGKVLFSPWALLGPIGMGIGFMKNEKKEAQIKERQDEALMRADEVQEDNSAEIAFQNDLEKKRKRGAGSDVVFAGLLGAKSREGLGGRKTLLGR